VLARLDEAVVEVPQLGALALRVPLPEVVAEGEDALLGAGALLVAAGSAAGQNALRARWRTTAESFPPENRITPRSTSAATSRITWIASDSRARRCGIS
jgi:hypothetical protein